jgi:hypothetical protein
MNISVFKINYNMYYYDRPASAAPRTGGDRVEMRPDFPDRTKLGQSAATEVVVAAENQVSAVAYLPKSTDPNVETNVLGIQTLMHDVPLAGTVPGSVAPSASAKPAVGTKPGRLTPAELKARGFSDAQIAAMK